MKIAANTQESQARVERLLPQTSPVVASVLECAMAAQELSREDGLVLAHTTGTMRQRWWRSPITCVGRWWATSSPMW